MSNVVKVKQILDNSVKKQSIMSEQHRFLRLIITHLDQFFQQIVSKPIENMEQIIQPEISAEAIKSSNQQVEITHQSRRLQNSNPSNMQNDEYGEQSSQEDESEIPSIEQISNFDDEKSLSESFQKKSKIIFKTKNDRRKLSRLLRDTKKPVSSFVYYYKERLRKIRKQKARENETINIGNLAKIISKQWKELGQKQKRPYVVKAEKSLRIYYKQKEKKYQSMTSTLNSSSKREKKQLKSLLDGSQCQKSEEKSQLTKGFCAFFKENSQRISQQSGYSQRRKLVKIALEQWSQLANEEREQYQSQSSKRRKKRDGQEDEIDAHKTSTKRKPSKQQEEEYKPKIRIKNGKLSEMMKNHEPHENIGDKWICLPRRENQNFSIGHQLKDLLSKPIRKQSSGLQDIDGKIKSESHDIKHAQTGNIHNKTVIEVDSNDQMSHSMKDESDWKNEQLALHRQQKKMKGPSSPFLLFYQRNVKKLMTANSNAHGSQLIKVASARWNELSEEQKQFYQDLARKSRQKYAQQMNRTGVQDNMTTKKKKKQIE